MREGRGMGPGYGPGVDKPQAQVLENLAHNLRVGNEGDHTQGTGALGALQWIDFVDLLY